MENKNWIWIGLASLVCIAFIAFILYLRRKPSHPPSPPSIPSLSPPKPKEEKDSIKLVLDTLMNLKTSSTYQTGLSGEAGKGYAGTTTDPETSKQVALYDSDTVDKSCGMTFLQQSTNLIKGQDMILTIYRNIMGKDPVLCFKLSPVNTRIEMLGNATSGNGSIIPFVDKLNQNMKILNDMVAVLITRNDQDLLRQLGAIMAISLFMLTACTSPKQLSIQRNGDTAIMATMNQTELTTSFLVSKSIPPSTISYKRKDVYDIENDKGKVSMDAVQTYFLNLAKTKNLSTTGSTGDIAAAQQMGKDLQALVTKTIQVDDLGKILLLGTYYGPFGQLVKKPYPCDS
jgi:hypothetical protein